jgi:hypothetical protein
MDILIFWVILQRKTSLVGVRRTTILKVSQKLSQKASY